VEVQEQQVNQVFHLLVVLEVTDYLLQLLVQQ
jgi:hypothetical protein